MSCPNCGDQARDGYANYCSTCGNRLKLTKNRSAFQTAAGVLIILASSMAVMLAMLFFIPFASFGVRAFSFYGSIFAISIFDFSAFLFGLLSGIFILRRQHFTFSLIGVCLVMVSAFTSIVYTVIPSAVGMLFGMPMFFLAFLALVFTAIARKEFISPD